MSVHDHNSTARHAFVVGMSGFGLVVGLGLAQACAISGYVEGHCANQDGDAYCLAKYGESDERRFCNIGTCAPDIADGCGAMRPTQDRCYSPCGRMKALDEDPDCEGVADDSSTSEGSMSASAGSSETSGPTTTTATGSTMSTTDASSSSGPQGCAGDDECSDPASPVCIDQVCSPCGSDAQCAAKDPANPACRDDGQCVQCTASNDTGCDGTTPICDAAVSACVGCNFHEECPDSACRIGTGECFDEADVHTVGTGMEYDNFTDAATDLGGDMAVLRVASGVDFNEAIVLTGATTVWAIVDANPDDMMLPLWIRSSGNTSTLSIDSGAEVYIHGISVSQNAYAMAPGIAVDNAALYLDRSRVVTNLGGGISLDNGAYALVRNAFVGGNTQDVDALRINASDADILYSTVLAAQQFEDVNALKCIAEGTVSVRNSLFAMLGSPAEVDCPSATFEHNASETGLGGTNVDLPDIMPGWFANFTNDFSLGTTPPAPILTAAQWHDGDPLIDIDGEARPNIDGSADVAGADLP